MFEFLKSKLGMFLAGIYVLLVISTIAEVMGGKPHSMDGLALLILTAPLGFSLLLFLEILGVTVKENWTLLYFLVALGGLINALSLCFIGYLLTKALEHLSSIGKGR
jgi:hypothetical protein